MASRVTLSDVARAAGVSPATASRAVNGSATRSVRPDLRERVLAAAARLHYVPDATAQAMARGHATSLALVVDDPTDPATATVTAGVLAACEAAGLPVTLAGTAGAHARELQRRRAAPVVVVAWHALPAALDALVAAGGSAVVVGDVVAGLDAVLPDDAAGADALARALHGRGYRRPAVLAGPDAHAPSRARRDALAAAFAALGSPVDPAHVVPGALTHTGGQAAMAELLAPGPDVDVVVAVDDVVALGAWAAARERGLRVPDDVALAGFGDIAPLRHVVPGLTTVRVPFAALGEGAVEVALDGHPGRGRVRRLPVAVVLRDSTPPVPAA